MKISEEREGRTYSPKQKIRKRYKGIDADMLDAIPVIPQENVHNSVKNYVQVYILPEYPQTIPDQLHPMSFRKVNMKMRLNRHENWILHNRKRPTIEAFICYAISYTNSLIRMVLIASRITLLICLALSSLSTRPIITSLIPDCSITSFSSSSNA